MKKILYIIFFISTALLFSEISFAETRDCSQYSTKTFSGLSNYMRCKKGLPPKKNFFESLKIKKKILMYLLAKKNLTVSNTPQKPLLG